MCGFCNVWMLLPLIPVSKPDKKLCSAERHAKIPVHSMPFSACIGHTAVELEQ